MIGTRGGVANAREALRLFQQACKLDPSNRVACRNIRMARSSIYNRLGVVVDRRGGIENLRRALSLYRLACRIEPANHVACRNARLAQGDLYNDLGIARIRRGDCAGAASYFRQALLRPATPSSRRVMRANLNIALRCVAVQAAAKRWEAAAKAAAAALPAVYRKVDRTVAEFVDRWAPKPRTPPSVFVDYKHGVIGGTGWTAQEYYLNLPPRLQNPKIRAEITRQAKLRLVNALDHSGLGGKLGLVDSGEYDFIVGVGLSSGFFTDLLKRVIFDNLAKGRATPQLSRAYRLLRGKRFETLDCHSNGAVVCLAAIANGDVKAREVRLLGPQMPLAALREWQKQAKEKHIKVTIYYNDRDIVPRVSYETGPMKVFGTPIEIGRAVAAGIVNAVRPGSAGATLKDAFERRAPALNVIRFKCTERSLQAKYTLKCHGLTNYRTYLAR